MIIVIILFLIIEQPLLSYTIRGNKIIYDVKKETIQTHGNTEITNANQTIKTNNSFFSLKDKNINTNNTEIWLNKTTYIKSKQITNSDIYIKANDITYTNCYDCENKTNAWKITATKFKDIKTSKTMVFYNPIFYVYDIPIFWFPYLEFPDPTNKYKSGILMPNIKGTYGMGTQINIPIYINFSNNHDLTITLSYLTKAKPIINTEHRLNLDHFKHNLFLSTTRDEYNKQRWYLSTQETIDLTQAINLELNIDTSSDKTYIQKYGFYKEQPFLDSNLKLNFFASNGYLTIDNHLFQDLRDYDYDYNIGKILPEVTLEYQSKPFIYNTFFKLNSNILNVYNKNNFTNRFVNKIELISPHYLYFGDKLTLNLALRNDLYYFNNTTLTLINESTFSGIKSRLLPSGYIDWSLPFVKEHKQWNFILEPNARLTFVKKTKNILFSKYNDSSGVFLSDTSLFTDERFKGLDLWENSSFIDLGIKNIII